MATRPAGGSGRQLADLLSGDGDAPAEDPVNLTPLPPEPQIAQTPGAEGTGGRTGSASGPLAAGQ